MKKLFTIFAILPISAIAQFNFSGGIGMSVTHLNTSTFIEGGYQASPAYLGLQVKGNIDGFVKAEIAPVVGVVGHWQNNRLHELSTMAFAKYVIPAYVPGKQLVKPEFAFGVRHHIYNAFVEGTYQTGQITITIGYSFRNPFN